jgi:hypothetical protein
VTGRFRALMIPIVSVSDSPSGLPIAITGSPTLITVEFPNVAGLRSDGELLIWSTAKSVEESVPTTEAAYVRPSLR